MQCQGTTQKKQQCKNVALAGSMYCAKHQDADVEISKASSFSPPPKKSVKKAKEGKDKEVKGSQGTKEKKESKHDSKHDSKHNKDKYIKIHQEEIAKGFTPYERLQRAALRWRRHYWQFREQMNHMEDICKRQGTRSHHEGKCIQILKKEHDRVWKEWREANDKSHNLANTIDDQSPFSFLTTSPNTPEEFEEKSNYWSPGIDQEAYFNRVLKDFEDVKTLKNWSSIAGQQYFTADLDILENAKSQEQKIMQLENSELNMDTTVDKFIRELDDVLSRYGVDVYA